MPTVINMHDAKSSLSRLVDRAAQGEDIVIARDGKPVARLTRLAERSGQNLFGKYAGKIQIADDFDDPISEFEDPIEP